MDAQPARITVERRSPGDVQQRQIVLSLDGQPLATLLYGESLTREITPGHHRLRAHNTLVWKNVDFECAPGSHARFVTVNRAGFGSAALVALLGAGPLYVSLERVPDDE
jgi:hypothetical protein